MLHSPKLSSESKPLLGMIWDYLLMIMIAYFAISIINSEVQSYLSERLLKKKQKDSPKKSQK